jgi:hypothetical protein
MTENTNGRTTTVQDVICMEIPVGIDPGDFLDDSPAQLALVQVLDERANEAIWGQWSPDHRPLRVDGFQAEWLITAEIEDVVLFQPAHDCEVCRQGNVKAERFLREHPGRWIAMGNLAYTPIWA